MNNPVVGTESIEHDALFDLPNVTLTSITVARTGAYTVAFMGSKQGMLYKVRAIFIMLI